MSENAWTFMLQKQLQKKKIIHMLYFIAAFSFKRTSISLTHCDQILTCQFINYYVGIPDLLLTCCVHTKAPLPTTSVGIPARSCGYRAWPITWQRCNVSNHGGAVWRCSSRSQRVSQELEYEPTVDTVVKPLVVVFCCSPSVPRFNMCSETLFSSPRL